MWRQRRRRVRWRRRWGRHWWRPWRRRRGWRRCGYTVPHRTVPRIVAITKRRPYGLEVERMVGPFTQTNCQTVHHELGHVTNLLRHVPCPRIWTPICAWARLKDRLGMRPNASDAVNRALQVDRINGVEVVLGHIGHRVFAISEPRVWKAAHVLSTLSTEYPRRPERDDMVALRNLRVFAKVSPQLDAGGNGEGASKGVAGEGNVTEPRGRVAT